jgi:ElaB/YqjD/DUF883 family membrane-anchored ribosome-binding protein
MPESDKSLPENSQENLDRKLDHAVKETFPTSDPVSVTITKGGAIDYDESGKPITGSRPEGAGGPDGGLLNQARETLGSAASSASDMARGAYEQGQRYVRQASERYPEAERYYREGTRAIREYVPENPLWTLLLGAVAGYGIAWMIHHERWRDRDDDVPEYARRDRRFTNGRR